VTVARAVAGDTFNADAFWEAKRTGLATAPALVAAGLAEGTAREGARAWRAAIEDDEWLALDSLLPAAVDALDTLHAARVAIVLLTARTRPGAVDRQLRALGVLERVDALLVVDPNSVVSAKAAELRRVRACALIGDTESDAAAAAEAGVPFLAVATGQRSPDFLAARGAGPVHADVGAAAAVLVGRLQASATT
jgi:phosphoglycolate phosphatase-like HAD superfamily hydrolase